MSRPGNDLDRTPTAVNRRGSSRRGGWVSPALVLAVTVVVVTALLGTATLAPPAHAGSANPTDLTTPVSTDAYEVQTDVVYGDGGETFDAYLPRDGRRDRPALVIVHGGGWSGGDKEAYGELAEKAATHQGWAAFSVNYRLAAEDAPGWPEEVDDVTDAVRAIAGDADRYGIDPHQVVLLGGSAGANLVALVGSLGLDQRTGADGATTTLAPSPATIRAVALWSAPTDLAALVNPAPGTAPVACQGDPACAYIWTAPVITTYLGCTPAQCPDTYRAASPLHQVRSTTPPTLVVSSRTEVVPLDQAEEYATALEQAGVDHQLLVLDGTDHSIQYADRAWSPTVQFLSDHLAGEGNRAAAVGDPTGGSEPSSAPTGALGVAVALAAVVAAVGVVGLVRSRRGR